MNGNGLYLWCYQIYWKGRHRHIPPDVILLGLFIYNTVSMYHCTWVYHWQYFYRSLVIPLGFMDGHTLWPPTLCVSLVSVPLQGSSCLRSMTACSLGTNGPFVSVTDCFCISASDIVTWFFTVAIDDAAAADDDDYKMCSYIFLTYFTSCIVLRFIYICRISE